MPVQLLPASAAAFAPRPSSVNVVLGPKPETWLTSTLKRIRRGRSRLKSVPQHQRFLTETLSLPNAIWTLTSFMLLKTPKSNFKRDASNPLVEATNYELVHVQAYIVHVDMVLRNEEIHCVDAKANTYDWTDKEQQCKKLHEAFVQDINKFVFRTHISALEGLEEGGAGELLCGRSEEVKNIIRALMKPLLPPPPPRFVEAVQQPEPLPESTINNMLSQTAFQGSHVVSDSRRAMALSPGETSSADSNIIPIWAPRTLTDLSPTPAFTQLHSTSGFFWSSPQVTAPIPALLPSMLAPAQYGVGMGMGGIGGICGSGWNQCQEYTSNVY
ncbi:hypothetical protein FSARC_6410 [Fusarium sarcochroum]|uniref:Uncharacterized protein n=1 Tax=Fusarium sarcochroum TaxID=1208366 RepID=A0A8H4TXJ7_9HYPO|nr:hypothetical protein FSARC_6410 [Fusarium sarcochroum]